MSTAKHTSVSDRTLGRYSLLCRLAAGGMGEVYLGKLQSMEGVSKPFAIKVLLPQMAERKDIVSMFITEARVASRMTHPNVCQVFELGIEGEELFICMEYLEGVPLSSVFKHHSPASPLPLRLALSVIQQACAGFNYAHELKDETGTPLGVVHRDISPSNLFLTNSGVLKILDFGIVKANNIDNNTRTGILKGKFCYMAPEHIKGHGIDHRADIFSLGVVLHELLTNRPLFSRNSEYDAIRGITELPIRPLDRGDLPRGLEDVVMKALSRDLDGRFATMREFSSALMPIVEQLGGALPADDLATYVQSTFASQLAERQQAIKAATDNVRLRLLKPVADTIDDHTEVTSHVSSADAPTSVAPLQPSQDSASVTEGVREPRRSSSALLSVLAAAGVAALIVVAVLLYLQSKNAPPVANIVYKGSLTPANATAATGVQSDASALPSTDALVTEVEIEVDAAPRTQSSQATSKPKSGCAAQKTIEARNQCHVAQKKSGFLRCLQTNSSSVTSLQTLSLSFDVAKSGTIESVSVSPPVADAAALESCLGRVAKTIRLGPQDSRARFRIPVKVRR